MTEYRNGLTDVIGIVLVGGKSKRMGKAKATIKYKGLRLFERTEILMKDFVESIYISGKTEQLKELKIDEKNFIPDAFDDIGPLAGILSVHKFLSGTKKALLVSATDLPFLDHETLSILIDNRDKSKMATMFRHPDTSFLEPLFAIYENQAFPLMLKEVEKGNYAIHRIFNEKDLNLIDLPKKRSLYNINYPGQLSELDQ